jgi:hypothetical protein
MSRLRLAVLSGACAIAVATALTPSTPAAARTFVSVGIGLPVVAAAPVYPAPVYAAPVYVAPAPYPAYAPAPYPVYAPYPAYYGYAPGVVIGTGWGWGWHHGWHGGWHH